MKKIINVFVTALILFGLITYFAINSEASSFVRRQKKERTDDSVHGRNWDRMDRLMDEMIDGRSGQSNDQNRFSRRPQQNDRQNQGNNRQNQNRPR